MEIGASNDSHHDVCASKDRRSCQVVASEYSESEASDAELTEERATRRELLREGRTWATVGFEHNHVTYQEWAMATGKAPNTESECFAVGTSVQTRLANERMPKPGSWRTWLILSFIGIITGSLAVMVDNGLEEAFNSRLYLNDLVVDRVGSGRWGLLIQYLVFVTSCVALASVAGALVCFSSPLAAGSGIPEIKCYLNGILLSRVVSGGTLVAKALGIIFSVAAGLPVGKEGPMIHSGSVIGGLATRYSARLRDSVGIQQPMTLAHERRDLVAAGATAGVAAAFGAPMGACLFAIEEGTSHMNPTILIKLFVAAAWAAFVSRYMSSLRLLESDVIFQRLNAGLMGTAVPVFLERFEEMRYHVWELIVFMCIGILGGLCGGLFCYLNKLLTLKRKQWMPAPQFDRRGRLIVQRRDVLRFLEVLFVTFVISTVNFWIPVAMKGVPTKREDLDATQQLFWTSGTSGMRSLLHQQADQDYDPVLLSVFFVTHMALTCWTYGLGVPSGLFVPSLVGGAAMGRLIGQALQPIATATPGIYALIGATGMLAGTARITISLAMILMEVTGNSQFSLPIFVTVMFARWTGNLFGRGIYDLHIVELKRVPLLEHEPEEEMLVVPASDVMASPVVHFKEVHPAEDVYSRLKSCSHNGFPVVRHGRAVGYMRRDILHFLINSRDALAGPEQTAKVVHWATMMRVLARKQPGLLDPSEGQLEGRFLDMRPYMTKDFYQMGEGASVHSCYTLFRTLGLRHLILHDEEGKLSGIISRKDLVLVQERLPPPIPSGKSGGQVSDDDGSEGSSSSTSSAFRRPAPDSAEPLDRSKSVSWSFCG